MCAKMLQALIKWAPSGIATGLTFHALWVQEWMQAVILSFLAGCSTLWVRFSDKFMEEAGKQAELRGESCALWLFKMIDVFTAESVQKVAFFWLRITTKFQARYYKRLVYTCRDFQTQGLDKGKILKLSRVFVPLKIIAKEATSISSSLVQNVISPDIKFEQKEIGDFLFAMGKDSSFRRIAILGAPGSGKTTLLRYISLAFATNTYRVLHPKTPKLIPVLLYLRNIYQELSKDPSPNLAEVITTQVEKLQSSDPLKPPINWFNDRLSQSQCLVMLDGLDEIADEQQRRKASHWVDQQMRIYPDTPFILTSRPFGYRTAQLEQEVLVLEVQPFSLKQMKKFIQNWYLQTEIMSRAGQEDLGVKEEAKQQADDLVERIYNSHSLLHMALNPLLLTMIGTVHRRGSALPGKRVELYKEICHVLLEKRQLAKRISEPLSATQKQSVLQVLALWLMTHETRQFSLLEFQELTQTQLARVSQGKINPNDFLHQVRDVSGLLVEKEQEGVYEFVHLSFQEYLAAAEIKKLNKEDLLVEAILNPSKLSWWAETILLYSAQSNATNLILTVLQHPSLDGLVIAYQCQDEALEVDPKVRQLLEDKLEQDLKSTDPAIYNMAAQVQLSRRLRYAATN